MKNLVNRISLVGSASAFLLLFTLLVPRAQAQLSDQEARVGIKGGINLSNLYVNDVSDEKAKFGAHAGLWAKIPVAAVFAVQPELLYTTAGSKIGSYTNVQGSQQQINFSLGYLQLPVLASLTAGPVSIQAGPYVSYLLSAKVKNLRVDNNGVPTTGQDPSSTEVNRDNFNAIDYGLAGGIALDIKGFQLGARYNYGLRNVGQTFLAETVTNGSKNSVAQVFIAFGL
ncbi:Outer membrane protein beta-barrel domain-containing protein [Catalinimonas alkaloidigena]|uniref:Outer membrane protein beta-barrel domain-containing protein n=1 Tax=Catalinimonas alkaloidigena TaxID=1075417 RepID=A0A1G9EYL5_9BACT|nr:porin family protein [Catalinimonas alkaloidigena]SDK81239.1 Outer membrane protein beta-barrel domain-containing protein [Catalinimonas alkaloidigena]